MTRFALLCAVLGLPLGLAYAFSLEREPVWLLLCGAALLLVLGSVWQLARGLRRPLGAAFLLGASLLLAAFQGARLISYFFQGEGFNARFFFHFGLNALTEGGAAYLPELGLLALYFLAVAAAAWACARHLPPPGRGWRQALPLLVLPALLLDPDARALLALPLERARATEQALLLEELDWDGLGLNPAALQPHEEAPRPGRNLLLIYLEGLETLYTDEAVFPGLTPNLNALARSGLRFTGLQQTEGTGWTIGGLLASQCGTPLLSTGGGGGNDVLQGGLLARVRCLGDVLADAGYRQVFLGGASTAFAGKGAFLRAHGYDEVLGRDELAAELSDPAYQSGWGLYDDSLFALAARRYRELVESGEPFQLSLLTLDTHHPEGQPSRSCPDYQPADNSILDAVHCSDHLLGRLFDEVSHLPAWEDTLVVLLSDHLAMRNAAFGHFPPGYERRLLLQVQGAGQGEIATPGTHMDIAPTLLDLLELRHGTAFLAGRSLLDSARAPLDPALANAPERLQVLARLNSERLSGRPPGLCESPQPLQVRDGRLYLAEREQPLTLGGLPLPLDSLARTHVLLASLDAEGALLGAQLLYRENLPHALSLQAGSPWLLLGPSEGPDGEVGLWLGRGTGGRLLSSMAAGDLALSAADCRSALAALNGAATSESALGGLQTRFPAICAAAPEAGVREDGLLRVPRVAFDQNWVSGELREEGEGRYRLLAQEVLGPIGDDMDDAAACHAWFSGAELVVPLRGAEGEEPLRLRLLPGEERRFELLEP